METEDFVRECLAVCEDRKAVDVRGYDVRGASTLADFYVFCSGNSAAQIGAITQHLQQMMKEHDRAVTVEGVPESRWVLLDAGDVLIHVFHPETRAYYNVEGLLTGARLVEVANSATAKADSNPR